ncbi:hypothetical protein B0H10DRAFT_1726717, partial [Mycena sp. CBHHK59/15]
WELSAWKELEVEGFGEAWKGLVEHWWRLEESTGFVNKLKSFSTSKHPKQIGQWVKSARKGTPRFVLATLMEEWGEWWVEIQPKWRIRDDGEMARDRGDNWDVLRCPGPNGFLNVLICLKWWCAALEFETQGWLTAVEEVSWV